MKMLAALLLGVLFVPPVNAEPDKITVTIADTYDFARGPAFYVDAPLTIQQKMMRDVVLARAACASFPKPFWLCANKPLRFFRGISGSGEEDMWGFVCPDEDWLKRHKYYPLKELTDASCEEARWDYDEKTYILPTLYVHSQLLAESSQGSQAAVVVRPGLVKRPDEVSISLIRLIANPKEFDGRYVSVAGFLQLDDEYENSLFVDEDSQKAHLRLNTVAVDFSASSAEIREKANISNLKYVIVAGRYVAGTNAFSYGKIDNVYRLGEGFH